jgi:hypothetical protein
VILDTNGNIFGGFTPVKWDDDEYGEDDDLWKADESLKSFLFTLKNPHNIPPRKFRLKEKAKHKAIICNSTWGPNFCDFGVADKCNANVKSFCHWFGTTYVNDTELAGDTVLTGGSKFTVKEIEIFEMIDPSRSTLLMEGEEEESDMDPNIVISSGSSSSSNPEFQISSGSDISD